MKLYTSLEGKAVFLNEDWRLPMIELVNQFFQQINSYKLDGVFKVKSGAARKMVDFYLKLSDSQKALTLGWVVERELVALILARIEEKPYLEEEKVLYVDLAVTKKGKRSRGYMKALLLEMEEWSRKKKIFIVELRALIENEPAISFWRKQGYKDFYIRFRKKI